jgi:hypothetical protein
VVITLTPPAAALRQRTLSTPVSPVALLGGAGMWNDAALAQTEPTYNFIAAVQRVAVPAPADVPVVDNQDHVAAKRATPPRGVPR